MAKFGAAFKLAGAAAGIAALKFGKDSVDAFNDSQKVAAQTEAVLKSTGGAAGVSAGQISKLAGQLQKLSGVEDEAIQSGQNMLLTFTNVKNGVGAGNDVFNQATKTLLDMSVALGTDAKTSAVQLGKALNDPIKGISALSRVGVTFTDEQKATIKTMVDMGDTAGAQKVILAELNKEFGGSAKAAGDAQSPMEKLSMRFGELQEKVGAALLPVLEKLTNIGIALIDFFSNLNPAVLGVIGAVGGLVTAALAISQAMKAWSAIQLAFNAVLAANPIVLVIAGIAALTAGVVLAYQHSETFRNIVDGAFRAVAAAATFMRDVAVGAFRFLVDNWLAQAEWITKAAAKAFGWVPGIGPKLREAARDVEAFRDKLAGIPDKEIRVTFKGGGGGDFGGRGASGSFGGARAHGGPVGLGRSYLVGEEGPELFVPDASGSIVPNGAGRSSGTGPAVSVTMHVNVPNYVGDKSDLIQAITKDGGGALTRFIIEELRRYTGRGGNLGIA